MTTVLKNLEDIRHRLAYVSDLVHGQDYAITYSHKEYHLLASESCVHTVIEAAEPYFRFRSIHTYPAGGGIQPIE